jgi:hydroxymethylpyrimidine pyrophosphatase-like HAD family hydrolase
VKALAVDLDGTLLGPDDAVSTRNRAAVEAAAAAGWHVILATARWYQLAGRTAHELGLVDPVIACSGAEVRRLVDGVDLLDVRLPAAFTDELYPLCDAAGGLVLAYQDDDVAVRSPVAPGLGLPEMRPIDALVGGAERTPRCVLVFGEELNAEVLASFGERWQDDVRFLVSMTGHGHPVLTLTSAQADKGRALRVACADLGIDPADVVAMGDSETDIEMFRVAGASVAMGQASAAVRDAATWTTAGHHADGVGLAIEALLDGREPSA